MSLRFADAEQLHVWGSSLVTGYTGPMLLRKSRSGLTNNRLFFLITANNTSSRARTGNIGSNSTEPIVNQSWFISTWVDQSTDSADMYDSTNDSITRSTFTNHVTGSTHNSQVSLGMPGSEVFVGSIQNWAFFIGESHESSSGIVITNRLSKNY